MMRLFLVAVDSKEKSGASGLKLTPQNTGTQTARGTGRLALALTAHVIIKGRVASSNYRHGLTDTLLTASVRWVHTYKHAGFIESGRGTCNNDVRRSQINYGLVTAAMPRCTGEVAHYGTQPVQQSCLFLCLCREEHNVRLLICREDRREGVPVVEPAELREAADLYTIGTGGV
jgi:hypothetical protein